MDILGQRLKNIFGGVEADALLLYNSDKAESNFLYLTGFYGGVFEDTALVATPFEVHVFTSKLEYETAVEQSIRNKRIHVHQISDVGSFEVQLRRMLEGKIVGIDYVRMPYAYYKKFKNIGKVRKFVDVGKKFSEARAIKSGEEIELMKKAISITKKAFGEVSQYFEEGMSEVELAGRFEYLLREKGSEGLAFDTIVSFGKNAALPHHSPDNTKLKENEIVLIDAGGKYKNYCADMTRTFIFKADKSSKRHAMMKEMLDVVEKAHDDALDLMREGEQASSAHNLAASIIDGFGNGKYKGRFIHSLGHSIGLDVHDGLAISSNSKTVLKENMVFSDEPGIYVPGFAGVRIEDDVLIGKRRGILL
ncbi:MAG: M24 family metallopeptidase [Candidatus Micrarchaeia archaeon]